MEQTTITSGKRRVLFATQICYLDTHNGASVASRSLMECLSRLGFTVAAMSGTVLELTQEHDPGQWLADQGLIPEPGFDHARSSNDSGSRSDTPHYYRLLARGVPALPHRSPTTIPHEPDEAESREFLGLFEGVLDEFRPEVVVNFGGDALALEVRRRARARNATVVFALHNFNYRNRAAFEDADAIIVPSRFAASYYRKTLGIECRALPNLVDFDRTR